MSRAAIFASATLAIAASAAACHDPTMAMYGGPPAPMDFDAAIPTTEVTSAADASAPDAAPTALPDAATPDATDTPDARMPRHAPHPQHPMPAPMYGLAPHHDPMQGPSQ